MGRTFHVALSVDIDRFSDAKIRREYLPMFAAAGVLDVNTVRRLCAEHREQGFEVFPPCKRTKPNGACAGHDPAKPGESRCRPRFGACGLVSGHTGMHDAFDGPWSDLPDDRSDDDE